MKTIKPIVIESKGNKETLIDLAKRAINNAYCNSTIVRLVIDGIDCLVYPEDRLNTVIHYVKLQQVLKRLKELEA
jgi:hypothetical protein